jgi:hypothetical protein
VVQALAKDRSTVRPLDNAFIFQPFEIPTNGGFGGIEHEAQIDASSDPVNG